MDTYTTLRDRLVFGLDIGTRSVVGTVGYKEGDKFVVVAQRSVEHQTRAMLDGQIHDVARVGNTILIVKSMLESVLGFELKDVCIAAAGRVLKTVDTHVEHEFEDAKQFAEWGVDYLKYDNCFKPQHMQDETLYRRMHLALCASGRDIVFSACQWGTENVHDWIQTTGAHLFRSTGDINDSWNSIKDIALSQLDKQVFSGPGCHNDMDMLVVGMYGHGGNEYISAGGCSDDEYMTHFALWALMRSPLMIGCDVRNMSEAAKKILTNRSLIAINQDPDCNAPFTVNCTTNAPEAIVIARFLTNGDIALGLFNMGDALAPIAVDFFDLGLPYRSGCELELFDCINEQAYGTRREMMIETVKAHACRIFRCKLKPVNA